MHEMDWSVSVEENEENSEQQAFLKEA